MSGREKIVDSGGGHRVTPSTLRWLLLREDINSFACQIAQSNSAGLRVLDDFSTHARVPITMQVSGDAARRLTLVRRLVKKGGDIVGHGDEMIDLHGLTSLGRYALRLALDAALTFRQLTMPLLPFRWLRDFDRLNRSHLVLRTIRGQVRILRGYDVGAGLGEVEGRVHHARLHSIRHSRTQHSFASATRDAHPIVSLD